VQASLSKGAGIAHSLSLGRRLGACTAALGRDSAWVTEGWRRLRRPESGVPRLACVSSQGCSE